MTSINYNPLRGEVRTGKIQTHLERLLGTGMLKVPTTQFRDPRTL